MPANAMAPATNTKVRSLLWGIDLQSWEQWMLAALGVAALAAVSVVVTTAAVVVLTRSAAERAKQELDAYKSTAEAQVAEAKREGMAAGQKAGNAILRAAELEKEASALEADNLSLQTALRPRRLSFIGWTNDPNKVSAIYEPLKKFKGTIAFIQVVPDFEARLFAQDISQVLTSAEWNPQFVTESQSHMTELSFVEGLTLFTLTDGKSITEAGSALWLALNEANVMMSGTGTFGATVLHEILDKPKPGYPHFDPPVTAVFVRVGVKPSTAQFLEIQRRNMERQERRIDRALKDAYARSGSVLFGVPGHAAVAVRPDEHGNWVAVNPAEQHLLPPRSSPTLVLPGGVMLRTSPPPTKQ